MVSSKVVINNTIGLHLRPAGILCQEAMNYKSRISFKKNSCTANAKSVISVLGASVKHGDEIELICDGEDEKIALERMIHVIQTGLGEKL
jgi:phosphocarrier protein